jgi:paraquat-inducible protein A
MNMQQPPVNSSENIPEETHCHECAMMVKIPSLSHKESASCPMCGMSLTTFRRNAFEYVVAYALAAIIFLFASVPFEFLSFKAQGQSKSIDAINTVTVIQVLAIFVIPVLMLTGMLYVLIPLRYGKVAPKAKAIADFVFRLIPWSMAEIFLIGVLVSLIKISSLADIGIGLSFYAYVGFTICLVASILYLDKFQLFYQLQQIEPIKIKPPQPISRQYKSENVQRTWALLVTSILFYVPANTLPIMYTTVLGDREPNTILGGIIHLWHGGSYPIAIVIFLASVFIPVAKLLVLAWLNYSVQSNSNVLSQERQLFYRITEFVGRWSMVDVFVVGILVSLIQLGNAMSIFPGPAALAFCGVVVLTMLAALNFDSRLIWHSNKTEND